MYAYLYLRNLLDAIKNGEEGQDLVEYALLLGLIALVAVAAVFAVGGRVDDIWTAILNLFDDVPGLPAAGA